MTTPSKADFLKLSKKHNLIPVYREILADLETPVSCFLKVGERPYSYLLESVEGGETMARYSFIGASHSLIFRSQDREITIQRSGCSDERFVTTKDPLFELEKLLSVYQEASVLGLPPFSGGAVGYMGYDAVRFIEKIPNKNPDVYKIPDSVFIFTDTLFVFDHLKKKIKVICNAHMDESSDPADVYDRAVQKINDEIRVLRSGLSGNAAMFDPAKDAKPSFKSNFSEAEFKKIVLKAKEHIKKGDIFQVVLSQSLSTPIKAAPFDVYRSLRSVNPSPYMFYLNCKDFVLAGSSPEVHVRCEDRKAILRPIAGTRPRGRDTKEDQKLQQELLADTKEKAEHLMLVDLGRNDLGRVCEYKSVKVPEFMVIEKYSHVMHIVSLVEGLLKKGKTVFDLLRATFPAGTISGSPKVKAMEIIDKLENQKRGFYSGVVGYFSYSGNLDSCITIRTILMKDGTAYVQAGAGVVADSDPKKEYEETLNKARALLVAIANAEKGLGETF